MKHRIAQVLLPFVLACAADDGDDGATTAAASTAAASTTASSSSPGDDGTATATAGAETTSETGDTSSDGEGSSGAAISSDGSSGSDGGDSTGGRDTGGADLCAPQPADDGCVACAKQMCCEIYAACYGDPDCACAVDCILETGDYATCLGAQCNTPDPTPAMDIGLCYGTTCADACGF